MRVAPVALFYHAAPDQEVVTAAKDMARITHANRLGYNGTVLQVCLSMWFLNVQEVLPNLYKSLYGFYGHVHYFT